MFRLDASVYGAYSWVPGRALTRAGLVDNSPATSIVQREVDAQLQAKGYQRVEDSGDLSVSFMVAQQVGLQVESIDSRADVRWHIGRTVGSRALLWHRDVGDQSDRSIARENSLSRGVLGHGEKAGGSGEEDQERGLESLPEVSCDSGVMSRALAGSEWTLREMDGTVAEGIPITLRFAEGGRVFGNSGCNDFSGAYKADGDSLTFNPLATTRKMCLGPRMRQEERLLKALTSVHRFTATQTSWFSEVPGVEQPLRFGRSVAR